MKNICTILLSLLIIVSCSDSDNNVVSKKEGCAWNANCTSIAPDGAYDCIDDTIVECVEGKWETVIDCSKTQNSKGYACRCSGGCSLDYTQCKFGFSNCGYKYDTCGPNATPVTTGAWKCVDNIKAQNIYPSDNLIQPSLISLLDTRTPINMSYDFE